MAIPQQVLLINGDYIRQYTTLNKSVEEAYLRPSILNAQDMFIQPILGTDLYDKICVDTAAATISGAYLTLKDSYIKRALVEWTMHIALPTLTVKYDNGGVVERTAENTVAPSNAAMQRLINLHLDQAQFHTQRMYDYLCENSASFPEWSTNNTGQMWSQQNKYTSFGVVSKSNGQGTGFVPGWPYRIKP